jgi:hypothetical protein
MSLELVDSEVVVSAVVLKMNPDGVNPTVCKSLEFMAAQVTVAVNARLAAAGRETPGAGPTLTVVVPAATGSNGIVTLPRFAFVSNAELVVIVPTAVFELVTDAASATPGRGT